MSGVPPLRRFLLLIGTLFLFLHALPGDLVGQVFPASEGAPLPMGSTVGERYDRLVIQGGIMISGRGTPGTGRGMPPQGPVDIVVEDGRIIDIVNADPVHVALRGHDARPTGDRVIDASGMHVLPGLIDLHGHIPGNDGRSGPRGTEYYHRLLLGHGVTTVRDAGTGAGLEYMVEQRSLSAGNEIPAPRLFLYQRWPTTTRQGADPGHTPEEARALVRSYVERGADGIKVSTGPGQYPDVLRALTDEATSLGVGVVVDLKVSEADALVASEAGVRSIEHWYGVPDATLGRSQDFPLAYNYMDELDRFRWAGALWRDADQHPERVLEVLDRMIENGTAWTVTLGVYEANRDLFRARPCPGGKRSGTPACCNRGIPHRSSTPPTTSTGARRMRSVGATTSPSGCVTSVRSTSGEEPSAWAPTRDTSITSMVSP